MKICIIGHTERNYLPFMERYIEFFEKNGIEHDIICWQREQDALPAKENEYRYCEEPKEGIFNKFMSYMRFRKYVIKLLNKNKYDKVVVLTTVPCIALKGYLLKHFNNRYIFDFRDYSFEKFSPYKRLVDKLIDHSEFTTISSKGFMDFLDDNSKIIMNHNFNFTEFLNSTEEVELKTKSIINIGFVGGVRYYDENAALINQLKNTFKYQLWYIGQPIKSCDLEGYCKENEISNVSFIGKYDNKQKPELYKNIDIINSIYGDDSLEVTTALPNRLYEGCIFKKPIISSKGTYLGEVIDKYKLGMVVNVEKDDVLTMLNGYVDGFDSELFKKGCEAFLNDVKKDEATLYKKLEEFIK